MSENFPQKRTAIITGAASPRGIGRETAMVLAEQGWNIGIIDLDESAASKVAAEIAEQHGVQAMGVGASVTSEEDIDRAVKALEAGLPQIVGLVNIAGISSPTTYLEVGAEEWNRVFAVNLTGVHFTTQRVARIFVEKQIGRVVNVSSISAQRGGGTYSKAAYSSAKAGVVGFTRAVARELGAYNITVNAVSPGPIDTDIMGGELNEERRAAFIAEQIVPRMGTPRDVASSIAFLLSEDAGFITGQTLNINGGLHFS